jgi:hypothetical protein
MNKKKREQWMAEFEKLAVERSIYSPGKVDWDTATYLFNTGISAWDAVSSIHNRLISQLAKREPEVRESITEGEAES